MKWLLVLLSVLSLTVSSQLGDNKIDEASLRADLTRSVVIENLLKKFIESFRQKMLSGGGIIPVLDPYQATSIYLDEKYIPGLSLLLNDVKISKLSTFSVKSLKVKLVGLRLKIAFDFEVPLLEFEAGKYDLKLSLNETVLSGRGDAKINVIKPRVSGYIVAKLKVGFLSLRIHLEEAKINISLEEFDPHINGLSIGDEDVSDAINTYLKFFVPEAVKLYEETISKIASEQILTFGNKIFKDLNLKDILGKSF